MTTPDVLLRIGEVAVQQRTIRLYVDEADPDTGKAWLRRVDPAPVSDLGVIDGLGTPDPLPDLPSDWTHELVQEMTSAVIGAWERWQLPPRNLCTAEVEIDKRPLVVTTSPGAESVGFWGPENPGYENWVATVYMVGRTRVVNTVVHDVEPRVRPSWFYREWLGKDDTDPFGRAARRLLVEVAKRTSKRCAFLLESPHSRESSSV